VILLSMEGSSLRKFGTGFVDDVPWGTHLCQLYLTKQDLIDVLVPYFVAGLQGNECCFWVASAPLEAEEATNVLKRSIHSLDRYFRRKQIEILQFQEVYCPSNSFKAEELFQFLVEKERIALSQGFEGLRLASILPSTDKMLWSQLWKSFREYMNAANKAFSSHRIIALCGYPYKKCTPSNIIQIDAHYDGTLIKRNKGWFLIEDAEKRKENEELYKNIIQTSIDGFFAINSQGRFLEVNGAYCDLLGYSCDELLKMNVKDVEINETHEGIMQHIQNVSQQGHDRFETRQRRKDSQPVDIEISANHIRKEGSDRYFIFAHNITKRKRNEETITHSEAKFRELADSITDSFVALDSNLKYVYWNKACEKITGISAEDAIGRNLFEVFNEDEETKKVAATYMKVLKTRKSRVFVDELRIKGKKVAVENHIYPSKTGVSVFTKDITPRKELQEKLEEYTQHLEDLVKVRTEKLKASERLATIGETAGMVGHDIRNPLQTITGELYLTKAEVLSLPEGDTKRNLMESLQIIGDQLAYINKIVADLQDFAKVSKPVLEKVDLEKTIKEIMSTVTVPQDVRVVVAIRKDYPKLQSDPTYLKRIMINLVTNAVQAMPNGGKLSVKATWDEGNSIVTVEDTGQGIPEETKDKIFKPLFTTKAKGQGLGLAVVKKLVNALGGNITFESDIGKGTCFKVKIPLDT
jgi:PAS domain S-box-containing protein